MVEKLRLNVGRHALVAYNGARFIVDAESLDVLGRLYEGTLEPTSYVGETLCLMDNYLNEQTRQAVMEKMAARAVVPSAPATRV